jgi:O-antigen/teichoic acid export membrane protein
VQIVLVLTSPLLTRLYSPADFGIVGSFAALLAVLATIVTLRYSLAIPLPPTDQEAAHIATLALLITTVLAGCMAVVVLTVGPDALVALGLPELTRYVWLLPIALLLSGIHNTFSYWAIRTESFGVIARTKAAQGVGQIIVQLALFPLGAIGLVFGQLTGQTAGSTALARNALMGQRRAAFANVTAHDIARTAVRYRRFPLFSTWEGGLNALGTQLPTLLLVSLFGASAAGQYVLATRVLSAPLGLVGKAVADVFLSRGARARREGDLAMLVRRVHNALSSLAMPGVVLLMLAAPSVFGVVFGEEWDVAGRLARWMAPWLYFVFVTSPLSTLFTILEKQAQSAVFQATLLILRTGAIFGGARLGGLETAVAAFSIASAACYALLLWWIFRAAGSDNRTLVSATLKRLAVSIAVAAPLGTAMQFALSPSAIALAAAVSLTLLGAYYIRLLRDLLHRRERSAHEAT